MPETRIPDLPTWAAGGDRTQPSNSEINTGWPLTATPPSRQRFNWILNLLNRATRYLHQFGIPEWTATEGYPQHARVQLNGVTYRALSANTNQNPASQPTIWAPWASTTLRITTITATAGQTVFTAPYTVGGAWVTRNGLDVDFTGVNGTSITLTVAANAGDVIKVRSI